jgi:alkanesulfonate monooxygenase SsuD/methylene tetrahydromethanopterin reductase-like flavin-dependent oxidoreductase (luciferase family)
MRISISVTNYDGADLRAIAQAADEAGADTLWVADHLIQADPNAPMGRCSRRAPPSVTRRRQRAGTPGRHGQPVTFRE